MKYQGKSVLLVDDDVDLLQQMTAQLTSLGFSVVSAESQSAAETLLDGKQPDLAVIDLMLEYEDSGFVLAHRIKQRNPATPVVMVTAVASEFGFEFDASTREERSWVKADAVLNKPLRFEQLKKEIDRLLPE